MNRKIVERLRMISQLKAHQGMLIFSIGERFGFYDNVGVPNFGIVTKYNKKTVSLISDDNRQWNVSPSVLKKEADFRKSLLIINLHNQRQLSKIIHEYLLVIL